MIHPGGDDSWGSLIHGDDPFLYYIFFLHIIPMNVGLWQIFKYYTVLYFCTSYFWFIIRCCTFLDSESSSSFILNPWWSSTRGTRSWMSWWNARPTSSTSFLQCSGAPRCWMSGGSETVSGDENWKMSGVKVFHWLMVDIWTSLGSKLLKRDHSIHYWKSYKLKFGTEIWNQQLRRFRNFGHSS